MANKYPHQTQARNEEQEQEIDDAKCRIDSRSQTHEIQTPLFHHSPPRHQQGQEIRVSEEAGIPVPSNGWTHGVRHEEQTAESHLSLIGLRLRNIAIAFHNKKSLVTL